MRAMKQILKRVIPEKYRRKLRQMLNSLDYQVLKFLSKVQFLAPLYYALFSPAFKREYQTVIQGRLKNRQEINTKQGTQFRLRRYIHGIEKGLLMMPRRDIFGLDYIEETVRSFEQTVGNPGISSPSEMKWASDVLKEYFSGVAHHPVIDRARQRFEAIPALNYNGSLYVPHKREISLNPPVNYEDLISLAQQRKSVRWYLPTPVPRELIDKAICLAAYSPSACNRQPFEFRVFDAPELVAKVTSLPTGTRGFRQNIPVVVAVVGKLRAYATEWDRHLIYIDGSLASMAFMLALETLGLSSCSLNWPDIGALEKKMAEYLNLDRDERVIMLIALGYPDPDGMVASSQKKDLDLLRRYN
jgi:nitroreductase